MIQLIENWLILHGIPASTLPFVTSSIGLLCVFLLCGISYYITKNQILSVVYRIIIRSKNEWDDLLINHAVFTQASLLVPIVLLLFLTPILVPIDSEVNKVVSIIAKILMTIQIARTIGSLLNVVNSIYDLKSQRKELPFNASIQLIKLAVYLVAFILAISIAIGESPVYLLSGLGALTAVLLLVFQDTIKGLVASIQISANKMVAPGDWIEMPQYGADGDVLEIGLNTVKVQNWDRTITTIPTYALISQSFKNWRGMMQSGGRRVKRALQIDIGSVKFCDETMIDTLERFTLLKSYISAKKEAIRESRAAMNVADDDIYNARRLTNIGTFRAYIDVYLKQHPKVHKDMTCMVRQLPPTETGLPLELYFFSNDQKWINYEAIVADIFDHLVATAPLFELRIFQNPTGFDWQSRIKTID